MRTPKILARHAAWVLVVRENPTEYERNALAQACRTSAEVAALVRPRIAQEVTEVMYALALDGRNRCIAMAEVARGGLHGCSVAARDVLRPMVMSGASAFVLVHNHPSGDPRPSPEDVAMTRIVAEAATVVGISLVDHVIIGGGDAYASLLDLGVLS